MGDADIFVKRVDFEVNNNDAKPAAKATVVNGDGQVDVEKSGDPVANDSCMGKFCVFLEKFGIKSALSHIGLLVSLGLFCLGGGWVNHR